AILLSQKKKWRRKTIGPNSASIGMKERIRRWANYHPILASSLWSAAIKAGEIAAADPKVKIVHFEELVTKSQETVSEICEFLGLQYNASMLEVAASKSPTGGEFRMDSNGIDASVVERWKSGLGGADIYWCERTNGDRLQKLGYKLSGVRPTLFSLTICLMLLPFKLGLAALLNLGDNQNILVSIRRRFS
ncbi:hypothetical protein ACFL17_10615, partial [Pseudomonadota bacterium]